jgi:hypothetical protein
VLLVVVVEISARRWHDAQPRTLELLGLELLGLRRRRLVDADP